MHNKILHRQQYTLEYVMLSSVVKIHFVCNIKSYQVMFPEHFP